MPDSLPPPLPQTPPAWPAAPPTAPTRFSNRWLLWLLGVPVLFFGMVVVAGVFTPLILKSRKNHQRTLALHNVKQIGVALAMFEDDFGRYPDASTRSSVRKQMDGDFLLDGHSSNSYFRQLIAAGFTDTESMFYSGAMGTRQPDNRIDGPYALQHAITASTRRRKQ